MLILILFVLMSVQVSGVHWWYKTISHPAELMAGFYNCGHRDGYVPIVSMLKEHGAALYFTCVELRTSDQHREYPEALADPEGLVWQVYIIVFILRRIERLLYLY